MMKKFANLLIVTIFLFLSINIAYANETMVLADDVTNHYFEKEMREAIDLGILKGVEEGIYLPDGNVSRSEFAALIVRTLEKRNSLPLATNQPPSFSDVTTEDWFYEEVNLAASLGIINGYPDGTFAPTHSITRQEMAIMIERTLIALNIETVEAAIPFVDLTKTHPMFVQSIKVVYGLKLMNGVSDKVFSPLGVTSRGQAAAVLMRLYHLNPDDVTVEPEKQYKVSVVASDGSMKEEAAYATFDEAKQHLQNNQVIIFQDKIVYMKEGYAFTNGYSIIYEDANLLKSRTYVSGSTEVEYLDATEKAVKVKYGLYEGYIAKSVVTLVPWAQVKDRSYYFVQNGYLYHKIYDPVNKKYIATVEMTYAPSNMVANEKYYSDGTYTFRDTKGNVMEVPIYFSNLPLHLPTNYTAEELDKYLQDKFPYVGTSPLVGLGETFVKVANDYNLNALYLMAHAIHESAWGTSKIAKDKFNLYGFQAYDEDAYGSAKMYANFEESIIDAAKKVTTEYIINGGKYYYGAVLGNKSYGMNVKYASDPLWGEKIAAHMFRADNYLGKKDYNQYQLAFTLVNDLRVRDYYSAVNSQTLFTMTKAYAPVALVKDTDLSTTKDENGAQWFHIYTDHPTYRQGYVFGYGPLLGGTKEYVKLFTTTY